MRKAKEITVTKLGMESLYMHVFKSELQGENIGNRETNLLCNSTGAHRALGDVQAMKAVFTHPSLSCLSKIQIVSPSQQLKSWVNQKSLHQRTTSLISTLGKLAIPRWASETLVRGQG